MYTKPPTDEISIGEFEKFALDRLGVLRHLETLLAKNQRDAIPAFLRKAVREMKLHGRKDHLSHFVLRLAFCQTEESRRWLTEYEKVLFRYRFKEATSDDKKVFFDNYKLGYESISKRQLLDEVGSDGSWYGNDSSRFYKVSFEEALDLVRRRRVILKDGFAYVEQKALVTLLEAKFRVHMNKQLAKLARVRQSLKRDRRVGPLVAALGSGSTGPSYKSQQFNGRVSVDMIPMVAARSFPLCMQHMYSKLKENSHMRYEGRQTFGLFLKGIGLSMDESLTFWRKAFARKVGGDKFQKNYAYNIRHSYGQEGKRADYTPHSCLKIIRATPGNGEYHSCPFKQFDTQGLQSTLRTKGLKDSEISEIVKLTKGFHFGVACQKFFIATHGRDPHEELALEVGSHPNQYFDQSWKYHQEKAQKAAEKKKKENGKMKLEGGTDSTTQQQPITA